MHGFFVVIGHKKSIIVRQLNINGLTRQSIYCWRYGRKTIDTREPVIKGVSIVASGNAGRSFRKELPLVAGFVVPATAMPCLIPMNHLQ
jgi:hypothetical protein